MHFIAIISRDGYNIKQAKKIVTPYGWSVAVHNACR